MSGTQKVKIIARLRPRLKGEVDDASLKVTHSSGSQQPFVSVANPRDPSQIFNFPFTSAYDGTSTQNEVFENDIKPLLDVVFSGVTVTVFAYGVTNSGKTHTMQGSKVEPGVIPRVVRAMFESASIHHLSLSVSYMEIYKDECYDLLVERDRAIKLPVRENDQGMVFVANISSVPVASVTEFDALYSRATRNRSVGSTNLNHASSRSHAVLTIEVNITDETTGGILTGKINLVDLAGSENNKLTGNDASRMAESAAINKSLSVLGQVVHALNQGASRIPYRNSKLTRILQDALGGSSVAVLICCLAPGLAWRQDTLNTLNFAVRTKNIENKPVVNDKPSRPVSQPIVQPIIQPRQDAATQPYHVSTSSSSSSSSLASARPSLPTLSTFASVPAPRVSMAPPSIPRGPRQSMLPLPGSSRVPRASNIGVGARPRPRVSAAGLPGIIDEDLEAKIAKLVEVEVSKRIAVAERAFKKEKEDFERERELLRERERQIEEEEERRQSSFQDGPSEEVKQESNEELMNRLNELEERVRRDSRETAMAEVLSPSSRKKTGRAYVALARQHSERGDLAIALEFYRKAQTYVPDNEKLRERIIDIEYAVDNNLPYASSPTKARAPKRKANRSSKSAKHADGDSPRKERGGTVTEYIADENLPDGGTAGSDLDMVLDTKIPAKRARVETDDDLDIKAEDTDDLQEVEDVVSGNTMPTSMAHGDEVYRTPLRAL